MQGHTTKITSISIVVRVMVAIFITLRQVRAMSDIENLRQCDMIWRYQLERSES